MLFVCQDNAYTKFPWGQFPLGVKMASTETENNTYAKFWGDKKRALWCVMVFSAWSGQLRSLSGYATNLEIHPFM